MDFDGYYLEHDPCLVCNNPEIPFAVRLHRSVASVFCSSLQFISFQDDNFVNCNSSNNILRCRNSVIVSEMWEFSEKL